MVQCRVPATASELYEVRRWAEEAASAFGLGRTESFEFVFAVNEAVTNAIRHGRPFADGSIAVRIDDDGDSLVCLVSNQGTFEPAPDAPDSLAERGRGISAMSLLMDEIQFSSSPAGTTVALHKRRSKPAEHVI